MQSLVVDNSGGSNLTVSQATVAGSGFSLKGFAPSTKVVLRAFKSYGLVLADNGSDWYFQGTTDANWTDQILDELKSIPASRFVAVDVSGCQVSPDSGQALCPP
jgi:hypothetical protein